MTLRQRFYLIIVYILFPVFLWDCWENEMEYRQQYWTDKIKPLCPGQWVHIGTIYNSRSGLGEEV